MHHAPAVIRSEYSCYILWLALVMALSEAEPLLADTINLYGHASFPRTACKGCMCWSCTDSARMLVYNHLSYAETKMVRLMHFFSLYTAHYRPLHYNILVK